MALFSFGMLLILGCLGALLTPPAAPAQKNKGKGGQPIYGTLKLNAVFKTWWSLLESSGLTKIYQAQEPLVTMFAPTEDAFTKVNRDDLDELLKNKPKLI